MPHSTYSKIYDVLSTLNHVEEQDIFDLARQINENEFESFAIWRRPEGSDQTVKSYCSEASIRRLIRYMHSLGMIDIENQRVCRINEVGRNALTGDNYSTQLGSQIVRYLRVTVGLPFNDIQDQIASIQRPAIPDAQTLFQTLVISRNLPISEDEFRRLLYLLQRCGLLSGRIRKIYSS